MNDTSTRRRAAATVLLGVLYFLGAGWVMVVFTVYPGFNDHHRTLFADMVEGRAHRPFVYRTLVPSTIRLLSGAMPAPVRRGLADRLHRSKPARALGWEKKDEIPALVVAFGVMTLCLVGFAFALRGAARVLYAFPDPFSGLFPLAVLAFLPAFFKYYNYLYDPGTLLTFAWAVWALAARRTRLFYVVFGLAALNKETAVLLVPVFLTHEWSRLSTRGRVAHGAGLLAIYGVIKLGLHRVFSGNPGGIAEFTLLEHNVPLLGRPGVLLYMALVLGPLFVLALGGWREKPPLLRQGLLFVFLGQLGLAVFLGYLDELRVFYESLVFLVLLALPGVWMLLGGERGTGPYPEGDRP